MAFWFHFKSPIRWFRSVLRRMGRGKLIFVGHRRENPRSAELDPEVTRSTDQTLTELSLGSANSDGSAVILRDQDKAADRLAHIRSGLTAKEKDVLGKVQDVVETGDSLRDIALKADVHAMQVSRAFDAARKADKQQIFKRSNRGERPIANSYRPYNPRGVPMEIVMMPHQGPVLYTIKVPDRVACVQPSHPAHANGCSHPNRQWFRIGFGGLRLACLGCDAELDRAGILSRLEQFYFQSFQ